MRHRGGVPSVVGAAAWTKPEKAKKKSVRGISDQALVEALREFEAWAKEGLLSKAKGKHFVALYADLYCRVYLAPPSDLGPKERVYATKLANDMIARDFDGSAEKMAEFMAWGWSREKGREDYRKENPNRHGGGRISWRVQFGRSMLADFRVHEARTKNR